MFRREQTASSAPPVLPSNSQNKQESGADRESHSSRFAQRPAAPGESSRVRGAEIDLAL